MAKYEKTNEYNEFFVKLGDSFRRQDVDFTHDGYPLTVKEAKFIDIYLATANLKKSLVEAGVSYSTVVGKDYITDEIKWRLEELKKSTIADADEIMQYFTRVMRGEEKDQFGLDAPLSERTSAAKELARRQIDVIREQEQKVQDNTINIVLDWAR